MMAIDKVEVDGIYYEIFDSGLALVVKYNDVGDEIVYSGDIYLPDEITVDGVTYSVEGIESEVFMNCTELTSIRLPENLYEITRGVFSDEYIKNELLEIYRTSPQNEMIPRQNADFQKFAANLLINYIINNSDLSFLSNIEHNNAGQALASGHSLVVLP